MQRLHPPEPQTTVAKAELAMKSMLAGDILLSREKFHFTNMCIGGFWSHAAIYGDGQVVEAVAPCVQLVDFRDWALQKHYWCVLRPNQKDNTSGRDAFAFAKKQLGYLYDYGFERQNKLYYCSELVFDSWEAHSIWAQEEFLRRKANGDWTVLPEDFYNAAIQDKLKVIFEHRDK